MQSDKERKTTAETENVTTELENSTLLEKASAESQKETGQLGPELQKPGTLSSNKIGVAFIVPGVLALVLSIVNNYQILAFVGLGLTLWGALFLLVRPGTYVKGSLLDATVVPSYITVDRMIRDLRYKGKGFYIPPYPEKAHLPDHLKGLKEMVVFIPEHPQGAETGLPSIEEIAKGRFTLANPRGISLIAPGSGLLSQFEKELKLDPTAMKLEELCRTLPQLILQNFQLAKEMEMNFENGRVHLKITESVYDNLYRTGLQSVYTLGCPLVSAVACAIAKTTGRVVGIESVLLSRDAPETLVSYQFMEG